MDANKPWGKSIAINLQECNYKRLIDPKLLEQFVREVIKVVDMESHGPCHIDRFGDGELEGYSAMQFIKTSTITVHLDEVGNRAFIDIFSCKNFDGAKAEAFSKEFFQSQKATSVVLER